MFPGQGVICVILGEGHFVSSYKHGQFSVYLLEHTSTNPHPIVSVTDLAGFMTNQSGVMWLTLLDLWQTKEVWCDWPCWIYPPPSRASCLCSGSQRHVPFHECVPQYVAYHYHWHSYSGCDLHTCNIAVSLSYLQHKHYAYHIPKEHYAYHKLTGYYLSQTYRTLQLSQTYRTYAYQTYRTLCLSDLQNIILITNLQNITYHKPTEHYAYQTYRTLCLSQTYRTLYLP